MLGPVRLLDSNYGFSLLILGEITLPRRRALLQMETVQMQVQFGIQGEGLGLRGLGTVCRHALRYPRSGSRLQRRCMGR